MQSTAVYPPAGGWFQPLTHLTKSLIYAKYGSLSAGWRMVSATHHLTNIIIYFPFTGSAKIYN